MPGHRFVGIQRPTELDRLDTERVVAAASRDRDDNQESDCQQLDMRTHSNTMMSHAVRQLAEEVARVPRGAP